MALPAYDFSETVSTNKKLVPPGVAVFILCSNPHERAVTSAHLRHRGLLEKVHVYLCDEIRDRICIAIRYSRRWCRSCHRCGFSLDPLSEFVNCYKEVGVDPRGLLEGSE